MNRLGLILCCDFLMLNHGYDSRLWGASANAPRQTLPGRVLGGEMTLGDTQPKGIAIDAYTTDAGEHLDRCRAAGRLPDHACDPRPSRQMLGAREAPRTRLAGCPARHPRHVPSACKERSLPGYSRTEGHRQEEGEGGAVQLLGAKAGEKNVGHWKG